MADKKDKKSDKKPEVQVEVKKSRSIKDLKDIKSEVAATTTAAPSASAAGKVTDQKKERVQEIDAQGRAYGTGRRKDAVARVWIKRGSGKVTVNDRDQNDYFGRHTHRLILNQPFLIIKGVNHYDVVCTVTGGGLSGQAGAIRHGISRALEKFDPANRPELKKAGMMTRDARIVERKKVGKHKARRTKQWAKR